MSALSELMRNTEAAMASRGTPISLSGGSSGTGNAPAWMRNLGNVAGAVSDAVGNVQDAKLPPVTVQHQAVAPATPPILKYAALGALGFAVYKLATKKKGKK
jgi:hypothetical protein